MSRLGYFLGGMVVGAAALCASAYLTSRSSEQEEPEVWPNDEDESTAEASHG